MGADDFDFRPPPRRKAAQRFEPPPWEREAFERLQREKEKVAESGDVSAVEEAKDEPLPVVVPKPASSEPVSTGGDQSTELTEAKVLEMLAGLAEEEPKVADSLGPFQIVAALILGPLGIMMFVWGVAGIVAMRRTGLVGVFLGLVLLLFGAGFLLAALWMLYRTLKQRGVL